MDDATRIWREHEAPFFKVGELHVATQNVSAQAQFDASEALAYSPWNGLAVHRPVGNLNRLRGSVYPEIAKLRELTRN